jgi:hypothetical protein
MRRTTRRLRQDCWPWGAGNIRTTTLRAFSRDEMRGVIGKVPQ